MNPVNKSNNYSAIGVGRIIQGAKSIRIPFVILREEVTDWVTFVHGADYTWEIKPDLDKGTVSIKVNFSSPRKFDLNFSLSLEDETDLRWLVALKNSKVFQVNSPPATSFQPLGCHITINPQVLINTFNSVIKFSEDFMDEEALNELKQVFLGD